MSFICLPHSSQQPSRSVAPSSSGTSVSATTCVRRVSCTLGHSLKRTTTTGGPSPLGAGTTFTTVVDMQESVEIVVVGRAPNVKSLHLGHFECELLPNPNV